MAKYTDLTGIPVANGGTKGMWNNADNTKQLICVHTTESSRAGGALSWMRSQQNGSYHELTDTIGDIVRMVPDNRQSWSAMTQGNRRGLHLCAAGYASYRLPRMARRMTRRGEGPCSSPPRLLRRSPRRAAAKWASFPDLLEAHAQTMARWSRLYGIPLVRLTPAEVRAGKRGVCGHVDISRAFGETDHTDPGSGYPFLRVLARAQEINSPNLLGMTDAELDSVATNFAQLGPS